MNEKDKKPDYKKMYNIVKGLFDKTEHFSFGPHDETYFTLRVYEEAKNLIELVDMNCEREVILAAALLHDIGKTNLEENKVFDENGSLENAKKEWDNHPELGIPIAKKILSELGHSEGFITKVCHLIENHDKRKGLKEKSIELQILQDADLLADCGFAGFIRPFLYAGKFSQPVIETIEYAQNEKNRVESDILLNLEISRKIAREEMKVQNELVKGISKDIESDLL